MTVLAGAEREQRQALRRMKLVAAAFLLLATAVYAATVRLGSSGWAGYVNTAAEAGMVGALADWFAVTALFRRPLGLPIPHTAIIPTRKDALGRSLERFVAENFLAADVVRDKVRRVGVAQRAGGWLAEDAHADRVTAELAALARGAVAVLRDEDVSAVVDSTLVRRLAEWPWGPPAGRLLGQVVLDGTHHRLVDLAVAEAHGWLVAHQDVVVGAVLVQAPSWTPNWVDVRVANRVYDELLRFVEDTRDDPAHRVRLALDHFLLELAGDLRGNPATIAWAEQVKARLLAHPGVREGLAALWTTARRLLLAAIDDADSDLRRRASATLAAFGRRLESESDLQAKVDGWVEDATAHVVTTYRGEITAIISDTVNRWDGRETARKVELAVGRDLQFIRINGTVVGALAGLLIHGLTALFGR
ncbi:MAG: DUF445 domain-containing protein [Actinomycetota bacterium]|nr:DUF445 domain-containing protein [Actinomycetota bacterium]